MKVALLAPEYFGWIGAAEPSDMGELYDCLDGGEKFVICSLAMCMLYFTYVLI